jgi:hypothetical protein
MKNALVLCFTNLKSDARVTRQLDYLRPHFKITVVCFDAYDDPEIEIKRVRKIALTFRRKILLSMALLLGAYKIAYKMLYGHNEHHGVLEERKFDVIIANDIEALPAAFEIGAGHSKIYFDAHEYAPRQFEDRLYWRIFFKRFTMSLCRKYIPRVDGMSTINQGIATEYEKNFHVKPVIVTNAAPYVDLTPLVDVQYPIRLVHHGIFNISRQPDLMIDMMKGLDPNKFTLDLYYLLPGSASKKTRALLEQMKIQTNETSNIRILDPIKSSEIVETLHKKYDVGIILIPPVNFNYENALPNKLFDCIQARLGMAVAPLKEIATITQRYQIGVVSDDFTFQGMTKALKDLTIDQIADFKRNSQRAAEEMNSRKDGEIFISHLKSIVKDFPS